MVNTLWVILAVLTTLALRAMPQTNGQALTVNGSAQRVPVKQMNGKNYVDVEALARAANGSLSFNGNQMMLTLPATGQSSLSSGSSSDQETLSPEFARAAIEAMSSLREWHSALASAIENGYPITQEGLVRFQGQATTNLRLAQAAAKTDADQKGAQVLEDAYHKMNNLSEKYVAMRANMNYVAPEALNNDPANQTLVACGKALVAMVSNRQFTDVPACH